MNIIMLVENFAILHAFSLLQSGKEKGTTWDIAL